MDLLIKKITETTGTRLSDFGFYNIEFTIDSPSIEYDERKVKGRSGYIFDRATHRSRTIEVKARIKVATLLLKKTLVDRLNGFFMTGEPFYLTEMYPQSDELYSFELPGVSTGELIPQEQAQTEWIYRYKVIPTKDIDYSFIGKAPDGLKYDVKFEFKTAELPFGESDFITRNLVFTNRGTYYLQYSGTAPCRATEVPFKVKFTPSVNGKTFTLKIGNTTLTYNHSANFTTSTTFEISPAGVFIDGVNVADRTNYAYFNLEPTADMRIPATCSINGRLVIENFKELYY